MAARNCMGELGATEGSREINLKLTLSLLLPSAFMLVSIGRVEDEVVDRERHIQIGVIIGGVQSK